MARGGAREGAGRKIGDTKLTQEYLDKTIAYMERKKARRECPFVEELAVYELDVDTKTISNWCAKIDDEKFLQRAKPAKRKLHFDFFRAIKKLADMQLLFYKTKGLKDGRNTVAIFLMKANHGMIETSRKEVSGPGGGPIEYKPIEVADV